jgi:superfamily II DNA/RNA helicase
MSMKAMKVKKAPAAAAKQVILTTAETELQLRQDRARQEAMQIQVLDEPPYPFSNYTVKSSTGVPYAVEIRSLSDKINSCSCPDFQVNTLGTCKHIEGVLQYLDRTDKGKVAHWTDSGSPFIEIFSSGSDHSKVAIAWPNYDISPDFRETIRSFFSSNDTLISHPAVGIAAIEQTLAAHDPKDRDRIRISPQLQSWISDHKRKETQELSREQFLEDVKLGKRSMQILSVPLYPYQEEGVLHLAFKGRALLADEMGLGKTIQAIGACELLRRLQGIKRVLVVTPASLKGEWEEQIAKFTGLPTLMVRGSRGDRLEAYKKDAFFFLANYEQVRSDFAEIQKDLNPDVVILDEAQRIKNWQTKTAWAVKQLKSPYAFVLTGTPLENRIDEVYSIMQMVDPRILGPLFKFNQRFYDFNEKGKPLGYQNIAELHQILKPVLLRRLKKDVELQLPERTVNNFFVKMDEEQQVRYDEYKGKVAKLMHILKKRPLTPEESTRLQQGLACMRMLADTPYILDENCKICPKLEELKDILSEIMEGNQNKIIIFSEWERMLVLVREYIEKELKIPFAWHTGTVPQAKRLDDIKRFKSDPFCRFFLTTDSGSTGLNLQVANVVINLDLPWNPAKLEQRIARAWRKNQTKVVQVINMVSEDTIEHRMLATLSQKKNLADGVLDGIGDLDTMPLPSARMQILEELHLFSDEAPSLTSQDQEQPIKIPSLEDVKNQVIGHFNDRIHALDVHHDPSKNDRTMLVVVDKLDPVIKPKIEGFLQSQNDSMKLELLDQQTFALLQRLQEAGIISIHSKDSQSLYRSEAANRSYQTEMQRLLDEAKKMFKEGERKMKMSNILASGGFPLEALPPAKEALSLGLKCFSLIKKEADPEGELLLSHLQNSSSEVSMEHFAKTLQENVQERFRYYADMIDSFSLSCL